MPSGPPLAVPPRSAEQTSRLLLSSAFRYDTLETAENKRRVRDGKEPLFTVKLELSNLVLANPPRDAIGRGAEATEVPDEEKGLANDENLDKKQQKKKNKKKGTPSSFPVNPPLEPLLPPPAAVNVSLFDPDLHLLVGAAYRLPLERLQEAFAFQATPRQLLVVEVLGERADAMRRPAAELYQVLAWGAFPVESLRHAKDLALFAGSGQLLYVDAKLWPLESLAPTGKVLASLQCKSHISEDPALIRLLTELVPPGLIVPYAFAMDTPNPKAKAFRVVLDSLQLEPSTKATEAELEALLDPDTTWSVAVIAHNGYQQLSEGEEVPLALPKRAGRKHGQSGTEAAKASSSYSSSNSYSYSDEDSKRKRATTRRESKDGKRAGSSSSSSPLLVLEAVFPIAMSQLPVHASTSLVLAIRRRLPGQPPEVLGFCVFPLCLLPMKDRDLRVENLPALQGPFSCEDARLLLAECSTSYGRLPFTVTLALAFHDTDAPGAVTPALDAALSARLGRDPTTPTETVRGADTATVCGEVPVVPDKSGSGSSATLSGGPPEVREVDIDAPKALTVVPAQEEAEEKELCAPPPPVSAAAPTAEGRSTTTNGMSGDVFEFLNRIIEELHRVRVVQDDLLKLATSSSSKVLSPALQERLNAKLADDSADVIDLRPQPVAVPWQIRHKMVEAAQPILHPLTADRLDDYSKAVHHHTRSVFGIRFEGLTMDPAFEVPEDICFMFSFGPLPFQKVGPVQTARVEAGGTSDAASVQFTSKSYQLWDEQSNGGTVWCEPVTAEQLGDAAAAMETFKLRSDQTVLYLHVFDALTMFYVCTAPVALSHFHRPYHAEAALIPMDLPVQRDLSMTEQQVPENIFPVVLHAGQLHVTLFCVGVPPLTTYASESSTPQHRIIEPQNGSRLVVAKKLPQVKPLAAPLPPTPLEGGKAADTPAAEGGSPNAEKPPADGSPMHSEMAMTRNLHWQRAQYFKKSIQLQRGSGDVPGSPLPGVPDAHIAALSADPISMEYRLRLLEKERDAAKSRAIAYALQERLTIRHEVQVAAWRPQTVHTPFENPYSTAVEFFVDIPKTETAYCTTTANTLLLGPRHKTTIPLVIRLHDAVAAGSKAGGVPSTVVKLTARVYTQQRHLLRVIEVQVTILPPQVDRRYEMFGPPGSTVTKSLYARQYSAASLATPHNHDDLIQRLRQLGAVVSSSSPETTRATTSSMLDPITQHYVTAWEEIAITTTIPATYGQQREEYITLYRDAEKTQVMEVWELCIFPCNAITTREIFWGQTTVIALPAEATEDLYCSSDRVRVEPTATSYLLHIRPTGVGCEKMLLHTLQNDALVKTILTVPVIYPTPTATQVIELSMADVKRGPVLRRLTFVHRGEREEHFCIHHNYKFQLQVSPSRFYLAPGDTQHIHLRVDMLALPPGQLEGRWPLWIFINDAKDKTVESYYLQVILRMHQVTRIEN